MCNGTRLTARAGGGPADPLAAAGAGGAAAAQQRHDRPGLWDIENDCFNTLSTHWGLDHCYKHNATAAVNFILTLFVAYVLLPCFWLRNLKPQQRVRLTLIALGRELDRTLAGCRAPWYGQFASGP